MPRDKYIFDVNQIEEKCYLLLASFRASKHIHEFDKTLASDGIPLISVLELGIVEDCLISIAVRLRMIDDAMKSHNRTHHIPIFSVGHLMTKSSPQQEQLDIREACNKIIHAKTIKLLTKTELGSEHLAQSVSLAGSQGRKTWNAEIEVEAYVKAALFVANRYDEDWDVSTYRQASEVKLTVSKSKRSLG